MPRTVVFSFTQRPLLAWCRWAMLGFASAILIEAFSGDGIVGQLIFYCRFLGLLGDQSGFN